MFKFLAFLTEAIGWLQIMASPFFIGLGLAFIVYISLPNTTGLILSGIVAISGLAIGIFFANKAWRKGGTVAFMSEIDKTPETDDSPNTGMS